MNDCSKRTIIGLSVLIVWSLQIVSTFPVDSFLNSGESARAFMNSEVQFDDIYKSSNHSGCPNDCNSHGQCSHGKCTCYYFYSGDACQNRWREDKAWFGFWTFYFILVIFLHVGGIAWCAWNLYCMKEKLKKNHYSKWPISAYLMIMFIVASFIRVFAYSIDPHNEREILGPIADAVLFNLSIILWLSGGCLMFLYWIEIQRVSNIAGLNSVQKLRPVLLGFIAILIIVLLPASIVAYVTNVVELVLVYNIFLTIVFVGFIGLLTWSGINLMRVLRELTKFKSSHGTTNERETIFQVFLSKLSWLIMALDAILVALIVTLAVFEGVDARQHKWRYVVIHLFLRLEEFAVVAFTNLFVARKKPRGVDGTLVSQNSTMESFPIDPNVRVSLPRTASENKELWE